MASSYKNPNDIKVLPAKLTRALARYYINRHRQNRTVDLTRSESGRNIYEVTDGAKWDKSADLKAINAALPPKWSYSGSCGSFWFTMPHSSYREKVRVLKISEESFLL